MSDDCEAVPLARTFAVWAGSDAHRWRLLRGHAVFYPTRGEGIVRDVELVNGTAYVHVDYLRGSLSKYHADSFRANDIQLFSLPPTVSRAEATETFHERWPVIVRQREEEARRRQEEREEEEQEVAERLRVEAESREARERERREREAERREAAKAKEARRARLASIVAALRRHQRPDALANGLVDELAALVTGEPTGNLRELLAQLPAWVLLCDGLLTMTLALEPVAQVEVFWPTLDLPAGDLWGRLTVSVRLLAIYRAAYERRIPTALRRAIRAMHDEHPLVRCGLTLLAVTEIPQKRRGAFSFAHATLQDWVIEEAWSDSEYGATTYVVPRCPEELVTYCEGRRWHTKEDKQVPNGPPSRAFCPRERGSCSVVGPDDIPIGSRYGRVGARLFAQRTRHWSVWSMHELLEAAEVVPALEELQHPDDYIPRFGGWLNRLEDIWVRLQCSHCKVRMPPNFEYAKNLAVYNATVFSCRTRARPHDIDVYLTHCWSCVAPIDSRENVVRIEGLYLCLRCGSGPRYSRTYRQGDICPQCGRAGMREGLSDDRERLCEAPGCTHAIRLPQTRHMTGPGSSRQEPRTEHAWVDDE